MKKEDNVYVISGEFKGEKGKIIAILKKKNRAVLELTGLSEEKKQAIGRKTVKKSQQNQRGGLVERKVSTHISNLKLINEEKK
jgi:large subunit ribosomal protein L24